MSAIGPVGGGLQQLMSLRNQVADQSDALRQLREAGTATPTSDPLAGTTPDAAKTSFSDTLRATIDQVSATQTRAADISAAYERGEVTDIAQVMIARQEAGVAFEATLQVRNKLLSAYQEIMRMGV